MAGSETTTTYVDQDARRGQELPGPVQQVANADLDVRIHDGILFRRRPKLSQWQELPGQLSGPVAADGAKGERPETPSGARQGEFHHQAID